VFCLKCLFFVKRHGNDPPVLPKVLKSFQKVYLRYGWGNANHIKSVSLKDSEIRKLRFFFSDFVTQLPGSRLGAATSIGWDNNVFFVVSKTIRTLALLTFNLVPKALVAYLKIS